MGPSQPGPGRALHNSSLVQSKLKPKLMRETIRKQLTLIDFKRHNFNAADRERGLLGWSGERGHYLLISRANYFIN